MYLSFSAALLPLPSSTQCVPEGRGSIIRAITTVWRIRGKIIATVFCAVLCTTVQLYTTIRINISALLTAECWFRFRFSFSSFGCFFMVAICNRADHYIFILFLSSFFLLSFFFLSFFSSPNLSGRRLDVYHTLAHGVALVRI